MIPSVRCTILPPTTTGPIEGGLTVSRPLEPVCSLTVYGLPGVEMKLLEVVLTVIKNLVQAYPGLDVDPSWTFEDTTNGPTIEG